MKSLVITILLALSGSGMAQDASKLPEAPSVSLKRPLTLLKPSTAKLDMSLESADSLLRGLDAYTTHRVISQPGGYERDPLMPNTSNIGLISAAQAGYGMLIMGGSHYLRAKGHPRWARALVIADIVSESVAVGNNFHVMSTQKHSSAFPLGSSSPR